MKHLILNIALILGTLACFSQPPNRIWELMPFELNQTPRSFFEDTLTDELIILGNFWRVDNQASKGIIRWDGQDYTRPFLNEPFVNTPLHAFRIGDSICYGGFIGLGCENDSSFFWVDSSGLVVYGSVRFQDQLIIHGQFDTLGGVATGGIIAWDGTAFTNPLGLDTVIEAEDDQVIAAAVYKDQLYVGGNINLSNPLSELLRWDGNKWTDVGGGIPTGSIGLVWDMVEYKGSLYVSGGFNKLQGGPGDNIARWDGQRWHEVGSGVGSSNPTASEVSDMMVYEDELWVVGTFKEAGGIPTNGIAKWDGERWCGLGTDFEGSLECIIAFDDTIYVGGGIRSFYGDSLLRWMLKLRDHTYVDSCGPRIVNSNLAQAEDSIRIFPNPTSEILHLEAENLHSQHIQFFDLQGRELYPPINHSPQKNQLAIHVSGLPPGLYLIRLGQKVQKVWVR